MYLCVCIYLFIILHHYKSQLAFFEVQASDFGPEIDHHKLQHQNSSWGQTQAVLIPISGLGGKKKKKREHV